MNDAGAPTPEADEQAGASAPNQESETSRIDKALAAEPEEEEGPRADRDDGEGTRELALDTPDANRIARRVRPTVLVLAGRVDSGKTSVYAAIYERLSRGPFAGRMFAGSKTIPGFEQRVHLWRKASGAKQPYMEHTNAEDLPWLHLGLRNVDLDHPPQDLLLGDFDGEIFDQLLTNQIQPRELPYLRRADHLGVVVDGAHIADPAHRVGELQSVGYLVDALLKEGGAAGPRVLSLVLTKVDLIDGVESPDEQAQIQRAVTQLHDEVRAKTHNDLPIIRVAARPATDRFPLGHGLESLLELLTVRPAFRLEPAPPVLSGGGALVEFQA